jgi:hypothetical protein
MSEEDWGRTELEEERIDLRNEIDEMSGFDVRQVAIDRGGIGKD